jgi:hypothetical protein
MSTLVTTFSDRTGDEDRSNARYPQFTATAVAEVDDYSNASRFDKTLLNTLTPGEIMTQSILTDRRVATDPQAARRDCSIELGAAIADKVEQDLLGNFSSLTAGTIGAAGTTITWEHFFAARTVLRGNKVPGPYICVLHEYQWHQLATAVAMTSTVTNIPAGMVNDVNRRFYIGTVADVDIFTTANISVDADDDAYGAMYNRDAIALDVRRAPRLEPERDASARAFELNFSMHYAHGVWYDDMGVQMLFDASVPDGTG